jgi:hypothetical protein
LLDVRNFKAGVLVRFAAIEAAERSQAESRCWASKHAPLSHTISTMVAIFLAMTA